MSSERDHGGGLDAAIAHYGGTRASWIDLSTGINPVPYPMPALPDDAWTALPDQNAQQLLIDRARSHWNIPKEAAIIAAPGASVLISQIPLLRPAGRVSIPGPTYNEHGAAFRAAHWTLDDDGMDALVVVHPNNPDGHIWDKNIIDAPFTIIDESFCDVAPEQSLIGLANRKGTVVLKSFGKFWGLAGLRLGFAIGDPALIARLSERLGPWPVAGPALEVGAEALADPQWADDTRARLKIDAQRMDDLLISKGAKVVGGTTLFRLYEVDDAKAAQDQLAKNHVWSRIFPYADNWLRLGMPHPLRWGQVEAAF